MKCFKTSWVIVETVQLAITIRNKFEIIKDVCPSDLIYTCFRNSEVEEQADKLQKTLSSYTLKNNAIPLGFQNNLAHGAQLVKTPFVLQCTCEGIIDYYSHAVYTQHKQFWNLCITTMVNHVFMSFSAVEITCTIYHIFNYILHHLRVYCKLTTWPCSFQLAWLLSW